MEGDEDPPTEDWIAWEDSTVSEPRKLTEYYPKIVGKTFEGTIAGNKGVIYTVRNTDSPRPSRMEVEVRGNESRIFTVMVHHHYKDKERQ